MLNESRITRKGLARVSVQDKFSVWEEHEEEAERKWQQEVCGEGRVACLRVLDTPSTLHFLIKFLHCKCKMNLALLCSHMSSPCLEVVTTATGGWTVGQLAGLTDCQTD